MALPAQPLSPPDDQRGNDPLSPTTLIYNYLRQQGLPPTSENVSRALSANASNRGTIPGMDYNMPGAPQPVALINDVPSVDQPSRGGGTKRSSAPPPPRWDIPQDDSWDLRGATPPPTLPAASNMPRMMDWLADRAPDFRLGGPQLPPPNEPSRVGVGRTPQLTPPPSGAQAAIPSPTPLETPMNRAVGAPEVPPPPALPSPPPQLALPAPPAAPNVPRIAAPPEVPQLPAPPARPALPAPPPPTNEPLPSLGQRILKGFQEGGGVRGAIGGRGVAGERGPGMRGAAVPGLAGLIMGGTGLADIYKEWQRQHGGG